MVMYFSEVPKVIFFEKILGKKIFSTKELDKCLDAKWGIQVDVIAYQKQGMDTIYKEDRNPNSDEIRKDINKFVEGAHNYLKDLKEHLLEKNEKRFLLLFKKKRWDEEYVNEMIEDIDVYKKMGKVEELRYESLLNKNIRSFPNPDFADKFAWEAAELYQLRDEKDVRKFKKQFDEAMKYYFYFTNHITNGEDIIFPLYKKKESKKDYENILNYIHKNYSLSKLDEEDLDKIYLSAITNKDPEDAFKHYVQGAYKEIELGKSSLHDLKKEYYKKYYYKE